MNYEEEKEQYHRSNGMKYTRENGLLFVFVMSILMMWCLMIPIMNHYMKLDALVFGIVIIGSLAMIPVWKYFERKRLLSTNVN